MVIKILARVLQEHSSDDSGYLLTAQFTTTPPGKDISTSKFTENGARNSRFTAMDIDILTEHVASIDDTSSHSEDRRPKVDIIRDPQGKYFISTKAPSHGSPWRKIMRQLISWTSNESGKADEKYPPPPEDLDIAKLRHCLEDKYSHGYTVSQCAQYGPDALDCIFSILPPSDSPVTEAVEVAIHVPGIYSCFGFYDLAYYLGEEFRQKAEEKPSIDDLNAAIFFEALTFNSHYENNAASRDAYLHQLPQLTIQRYKLTHQKEDIKRGIRLAWSAFRRIDGETDLYLVASLELRTFLVEGYKVIGANPEVNSITDDYQRSLFSHPHLHPRVSVKLACVLGARYKTDHNIETLDSSISLLRDVVDLDNVDENDCCDALLNIGNNLLTRHDASRQAKDLEEAHRAYQRGLELAEQGHGDEMEIRWGLFALAEISNTISYHDSADIVRHALSRCPTTHPTRPRFCSVLSKFFIRTYNTSGSGPQTRNSAYLEKAMELAQEGLSLIDPSDEYYLGLLCHTASCQLISGIREAKTGHSPSASFDAASNNLHKALSVCEDMPTRHIPLAQFGRYHSTRFEELDDDPEHAEASEDYLLRALSTLEKDQHQPNAGKIRVTYISSLVRLYLHPYSPIINWFTAFDYLDKMLDIESCDSRTRLDNLYFAEKILQTSRKVGVKPRQNIPRKTDEDMKALNRLISHVHKKAVHMLSDITHLGPSAKTRLKSFEFFGDLTSNVTTFLILSGQDIPEAIEILEEGRTGFWTQPIQLRNELSLLPDSYRDQLGALFNHLERQSYVATNGDIDRSTHTEREIHNQVLSQELQRLTKEVRTLPGLDHFLMPKNYEYLHQAADQGPAVLLVSDWNLCFAHILRPFEEGQQRLGHQLKLNVTKRELKQLGEYLKRSNDNTRSMARSGGGGDIIDDDENEIEKLLGELDIKDGDEILRGDTYRLGQRAKGKSLTNLVFARLWERVVKPILDVLGFLDRKPGTQLPRIWWCPTTEFIFLPLHAAGISNAKGRSEYCMDYVVSSYTPTLSALINARKAMRPIRRAEVKTLLAAVPIPYEGERLHGTVAEMKRVKQKLSTVCSGTLIPLPPEEDATVDPTNGIMISTIAERLPEANILHLACHGKQDHNDPLESGFILKDGVFPITKLMPEPLPHAFLAVLSACETAKGDDIQPDQAVHLAAAMLFAGFKSIVATMWLMNDEDGGKVSQMVYDKLFEGESEYLDPTTIPYALHRVVQQMRKQGVQPSRWATFIHLGV